MKQTTKAVFKTTTLLDRLKKTQNLDFFLEKYQNHLRTFELSEHLKGLLQEKGLKQTAVILRSNLSRDYANQLFNGRKKNPSRDKLIMLALGFMLTCEETQALLRIVEFSPLYPKIKRDAALIYCINHQFDPIDTNLLLDKHGLRVLE